MVDESDKKEGKEETPGKKSVDNEGGKPDPATEGGEGKNSDTSTGSEDNGEANGEADKQAGKNSLIINAEKVATRIEEANKKLEKNLKKFEEIQAETILAGRSHGGGTEKETEDQKWAREAKERYAGTGMDPTPHDGTPTKYS